MTIRLFDKFDEHHTVATYSDVDYCDGFEIFFEDGSVEKIDTEFVDYEVMSTIADIRKISGLDKAKFARKYSIPYRTLQDWEAGIRNPPSYVLGLLERVVKEDFKN